MIGEGGDHSVYSFVTVYLLYFNEGHLEPVYMEVPSLFTYLGAQYSTSIRTRKPTSPKLQMPNVNTHNMPEEIHLIDTEQQQKEKYQVRFC